MYQCFIKFVPPFRIFLYQYLAIWWRSLKIMNSCMKTSSIMGSDIDISACTERSFFMVKKYKEILRYHLNVQMFHGRRRERLLIWNLKSNCLKKTKSPLFNWKRITKICPKNWARNMSQRSSSRKSMFDSAMWLANYLTNIHNLFQL